MPELGEPRSLRPPARLGEAGGTAGSHARQNSGSMEPSTAVRPQHALRFTVSWLALLVIGIATLVFGVVVLFVPSSDAQYLRAIGAAPIGMGLFGAVVTMTAYRRRERWAYFLLWYYPIFWTAHLIDNLPPGQDHVHQVVFIVLSLLGLLLPIDEFFHRARNLA